MEDPALVAAEKLAAVSHGSSSITNISDGLVSASPSDDFQHGYTPDDDDQPHNRGLDIQDNWENTLVSRIFIEPQGSVFHLVLIESSKGRTHKIESSPPLLL